MPTLASGDFIPSYIIPPFLPSSPIPADKSRRKSLCVCACVCVCLTSSDNRTVGITIFKSNLLKFDDVKRICQTCTLAGFRAMVQAGPAKPFRFVYISSSGTERDQTKRPLLMTEYLLMRARPRTRSSHSLPLRSSRGRCRHAWPSLLWLLATSILRALSGAPCCAGPMSARASASRSWLPPW
ncbi:hypothetical protein B0T25DRAFT_535841 [Lasiosphaeria hispida]|uniref:Uncharacterized protein n=1 Tax=Lasiosphaeria hispida TaxID=260671 RepID=A0AAJ0HST3_9PEZI|nr:hypothetical protein B0T25DRAFT_535841 [Lasiosphaeria hispida]